MHCAREKKLHKTSGNKNTETQVHYIPSTVSGLIHIVEWMIQHPDHSLQG